MCLGVCFELVEHLEKPLLLSLVLSQLVPEIIDVQFSGDDPVLIEAVVRRWTLEHNSV